MKTTHLVMPQDLNPFGNLFGGTMMGWMDICAALEAFRVTEKNCVTVNVSEINFKVPVKQGEIVEINGHYVDRSSRSLTIKVIANKLDRKNINPQVADATFIFVPVGEDGKAVTW